ncbi:MAG: fumarate hydratase, partial [Bacillota bacterium]|nr:fumarate hydratase [Bacillota bacterium]
MKEINAGLITETVRRLCIEANYCLPEDIRERISRCRGCEPWEPAGEILDRIIENYRIAEEYGTPICQDTGAACVFLELGQEAHVTGDLTDAVNEGVRRGYSDGYLRKSIVGDPINRVNTGDNTPAMIYYDIIPGERIRITVAPKGFGSENMSRIKMLKPSDGLAGVKNFVINTVE